MKKICSDYEEGDIIYVSEYSYKDGKQGKNHLFVIINVETGEAVRLEYFGFIVSSQIQKSQNNSNFKYNVALKANEKNGLNQDSIVKFDVLYSLSRENVSYKIGSVDIVDYMNFMETFSKSLQGNK